MLANQCLDLSSLLQRNRWAPSLPHSQDFGSRDSAVPQGVDDIGRLASLLVAPTQKHTMHLVRYSNGRNGCVSVSVVMGTGRMSRCHLSKHDRHSISRTAREQAQTAPQSEKSLKMGAHCVLVVPTHRHLLLKPSSPCSSLHMRRAAHTARRGRRARLN